MGEREPTSVFQEDSAFGDHYGNVAVDKLLAVRRIGQRNSDVCIIDASVKRNAEDAGWWVCKR